MSRALPPGQRVPNVDYEYPPQDTSDEEEDEEEEEDDDHRSIEENRRPFIDPSSGEEGEGEEEQRYQQEEDGQEEYQLEHPQIPPRGMNVSQLPIHVQQAMYRQSLRDAQRAQIEVQRQAHVHAPAQAQAQAHRYGIQQNAYAGRIHPSFSDAAISVAQRHAAISSGLSANSSASSMSVSVSSSPLPSAGSSVSSPSKGKLDELLRCFICYGRVNQPHLCPSCSKIGCKQCFLAWIDERGRESCPFCRAPLTAATLVNARFIGEMLSTLSEMGVSVDGASSGQAAVAAPSNSGCPSHPGQSLSYYCLTCSTSLCSDCAMFDTLHRGHEFSKLDLVYSEHVSLVQLEVTQLKERLMKMDAFCLILTSQLETLQKNKLEAQQHLREFLTTSQEETEKQAQSKMVPLLERKREIMKESQLLSRLLVDLAQQLDPNQLPKHELIKRTPDLIHHLYELHNKPLELAGSGNAPSGVAAQPLVADAKYSDELTPSWHASPIVRIERFQQRRREGREEEDHLREAKKQIAEFQAQIDACTTPEAIQALGPPPAPLRPATKEVLYSAPMIVHGSTWRMKLYPNGNGVAKGSYLSVFVELTSSALPNGPASQQHALEDALEKPAASTAVTPSSCPLPLSTASLSTHGPPPPLFGKYEYRVEMLPCPSAARWPKLSGILTAELEKCSSSDASTGGAPVLANQTVAAFLDHLLFIHAADSELCDEVHRFQSKIVSRIFASNFERGESWGYNRFVRTEVLTDEGYLDTSTSSANIGQSPASEEQKSETSVASGSSLPPSNVGSSADPEAGDLLFRFYIRPPSFYLQNHEQQLWIGQLESCVRDQANELERLRKSLGHDTPASSSEPPQLARATPPMRLPATITTSSSSSSSSTPPIIPGQLSDAEVRHATSGLPASSLPSNQLPRKIGTTSIAFHTPVLPAATGSLASATLHSRESSASSAPLNVPLVSEVLKVPTTDSDSESDVEHPGQPTDTHLFAVSAQMSGDEDESDDDDIDAPGSSLSSIPTDLPPPVKRDVVPVSLDPSIVVEGRVAPAPIASSSSLPLDHPLAPFSRLRAVLGQRANAQTAASTTPPALTQSQNDM